MNFKKLLFAALLFAAAFGSATAQNDTMRTIFHRDSVRYLGFYFAPEFQYGQSYSEFAAFSGGSAMLIFNKKFAIGLAGQHLVTNNFSPADVSPLQVRAGFGGLKMERTFRPNSAVHFGISLLAGGGMARVDSISNDNDFDFGGHGHGQNGRRFGGNTYFVAQPGLNLEANLIRHAKFFASANYRFASKTSGTDALVSADALTGFSVGAGLKIGIFDWRVQKLKWKKHGKSKN